MSELGSVFTYTGQKPEYVPPRVSIPFRIGLRSRKRLQRIQVKPAMWLVPVGTKIGELL